MIVFVFYIHTVENHTSSSAMQSIPTLPPLYPSLVLMIFECVIRLQAVQVQHYKDVLRKQGINLDDDEPVKVDTRLDDDC